MKIVINGHKDSLNNGNMLMVLGLIEGLKNENLECTFTLLSEIPDVDMERYPKHLDLEIIDRPWNRQKKGALRAMAAAGLFAAWVVAGKTFQFVSGQRPNFPWNRLCRAYEGADLAVDVCGDDITTAYGRLSPLQVLYELFIARLFGLKTVLLAQSIGPFDSIFMKGVANGLHYLADFITLRDEASFKCWRETTRPPGARSGMPNHVLADLMHLTEMPWATEASDGGPIVVNLSNYMVTAALATRRKGSGSGGVGDHIAAWAGFVEKLHEMTGREILLLPHTCRPGEGDDRYWQRRLYNACPSRLPVKQIDERLTTMEIQKIVSASAFVVASRMHLSLTAMKCGIPFLALAYSHKYTQLIACSISETSPVVFLDDTGNRRMFPEIEERFAFLWRNRQSFRKTIALHSQAAYTLAKENIGYLAMMADGAGMAIKSTMTHGYTLEPERGSSGRHL